MKTVDRDGTPSSSSIFEFEVVEATFWTGLGRWEIFVTVFEGVLGGIPDIEFTVNTMVE